MDDDDNGLLGAEEPKRVEPELFRTDVNAFTVLEGVEDIGLSDDDGKANDVVGGAVVLWPKGYTREHKSIEYWYKLEHEH